MKATTRKNGIRILIPVLCGVLAAGAVPLRPSHAALLGDYRYRDPSYAYAEEVGEADLVAAYAGEICDAERDFLEQNGEFSLNYRAAVDISAISTDFSDGILTVTPSAYSYAAENGSTVTWRPVSVEGEPLTDGVYTQEVGEEGEDFVTVRYRTQFTVVLSDLNAALTRASKAGNAASADIAGQQAAYDAEYARYLTQKQAYDDYVVALDAYENVQLPAYRAYLAQKAEWDAYQAYLGRLNSYNAAKTAHENGVKAHDEWLRKALEWSSYGRQYSQYLKDMEEYEKQLSSPDFQKMLRQIGYLDFMFEYTPCKGRLRNLYDAVMGNTVSTVIERRDEILEVYPHLQADLDKAAAATEKLRDLFFDYRYTATDYAEKYAFYIMMHDEMRTQITELLHAINTLYRDGRADVRGIIAKMERAEEFQILLSELYVMANLLTDGRVPDYKNYRYDSNFKIDVQSGRNWVKKSPMEILAGTLNIPEDIDDAAPIIGGVQFPPNQPEEPQRVSDPGPEPSIPADPGEPPAPVPAVAEPKRVEEPKRPNEAPMPEMPTPPSIPEDQAALADAYEKGLLDHGTATQNYSLVCETDVMRYFRNAHEISVRFYGDGTKTPIYTVTVVNFSAVEFPEELLPTRQKEGYVCTFSHWADSEGNAVDLSGLVSSLGTLSLYPVFREEPIPCRVMWSVNGEMREGSCLFDQIPVYDPALGGLERPADDFAYRFLGWASSYRGQVLSALPAARGDVTYYACYETSARVIWTVAGLPQRIEYPFGGEQIAYGDNPQRAPTATLGYLFTGWKSGSAAVENFPVAVSGTTYAYEAQFEEKPLFASGSLRAAVSREGDAFAVDGTAWADSKGRWGAEMLFVLLSAAQHPTLTVRFSRLTLVFSEALVSEMLTKNVTTMSATVDAKGQFPRLYVHLFDADGSEVFCETRVAVFANRTACGEYADVPAEGLDFYASDGEAVPAQEGEGAFSAQLLAGYVYELCRMYSVGVLADAQNRVTLTPARTRYREGETVTVDAVLLGEGFAITLIYAYYNEAGEFVSVPAEGLEFVMPAANVQLSAEVEYFEYTVTFEADGRTLYTATVRHGQHAGTPSFIPPKASDDEFSYTFSHWEDANGNRPEDVAVTQDVVFSAVFDAAPLPPSEEHGKSTLAQLIFAAKIVLPVVAALLVALAVFLIVRKIRKKRAVAAKELQEMPAPEEGTAQPAPEESAEESGGLSVEETQHIAPLQPEAPENAPDCGQNSAPEAPEEANAEASSCENAPGEGGQDLPKSPSDGECG